MLGAGGICQASLSSAQFYCEHKTVFKNKVYSLKRQRKEEIGLLLWT